MKKILFLIILINMNLFAQTDISRIKDFIDLELQHYPKANLRDLYKNYFQDAYGPGHMIPDTLGAGRYLDREISQAIWKDTLLWQPMGINHDYYRVNLRLVKNGTIPRDVLLQGMVESAMLARKPDIKSWEQEWAEIMNFIKVYKPDLPDLSTDEKVISDLFSESKVVMHHSEQYIREYQPHYRIVHRTVFERWLNLYQLSQSTTNSDY